MTIADPSPLPAAHSRPHSNRWRTNCFRAGALLVAAFPLGMLMVAGQLKPNSQGLGTHQQLGLPPCSMRVLLGIRCPSCGMTTSWSHFVRGQWGHSFQVNAGGFLLACFGLLISWLALQTCWSASAPSIRTQQTVTLISVGIVAVTLLDWALRLGLE